LKKFARYRIPMILGAILLMGLVSCTLEQKLADSFAKKPLEFNIQLFTPDILYKYNHKGEDIPGLDTLPEKIQDSLLFVHSKIIRNLSDSIYLDKYVNNFIDELRRLGFKVYIEGGVDSFLLVQPQSYVLNMAQVQIDEYYYPFEDSEEFNDSSYYRKFNLNAVDASTWFELSKMNAHKPVKTVLYSTLTVSDGFNGRFYNDVFFGDVKYKYTLDTLRVKDVYELAEYAGKKNASYLFDYFMNQYVAYHLPQGEEPQFYFHYNRFHKTVMDAGEERFEILQSK
jgi:hypothetical protein